MRVLSLVVTCVCFLSSMQCWAISNIESQRPGPLPEGFSGQLSLGFSGKTGDKREEDYSFSTRINLRRVDNLLFAIVSSQYGSTRSAKDTDDTFVHTRWIHTLDSSWAAEVFAQWEEDEFSNLVSRTLLGGGTRYLLASKENEYKLAVGFGGFRENETLDLSTYHLDTDTWRFNAYYSYNHNLNENASVGSTMYLQPANADVDDMRALFTFHLNVKMTKALKLTVGYQAKYDSRPAQNFDAVPFVDKSKVNTEYTTSLNYWF